MSRSLLRSNAALRGTIAALRTMQMASSLTAQTLMPSRSTNHARMMTRMHTLPRVAFSSSTTAASATPSTPASSSSSSVPLVQSIPVINLSGTFPAPGVSSESVAARRSEVAKQIDEACRSIGFFTIEGHGISEELIQRTWTITEKYFDLEAEEKNKIQMTKDYPYGYSGFGGESLSKGYGQSSRPDPKESFAIGPSNPAAGMPPVQWPRNPKEFQKNWQEYYASMERLAAHLLSLCAQGLNLPPNWFDAKIDRHRSALRALNYPKLDKPLEAGQVRAGAHTDYGSVTILLQDRVGGLQVRNRAGEWVDAIPRPHSFVINLGDLMARWSNDRWVSTLHRVVQPPHAAKLPPARRQSMAFFHNVNHDQIIECIPTCQSAEQPPKYPPITAWDLLIQKHAASTTY